MKTVRHEFPALIIVFAMLAANAALAVEMAEPKDVPPLFAEGEAPTCGIRRTKAFLESAPSVGFVYDTGNFNSPGERAESGLELLPRTRHFHLKDRPSGDSRGSCAVGSGVVPVARIVSAARDAGYGGWFTIEHFGATNMLECVKASASFLRVL